ncbi:unnamed protein product [Urochloa decumbens]|uniref:Glycosyltransferase N-terminal domain-containing protein n=1 Tax=Urochloa decumbens TaxID=240449 RepID=A0ABC8X323_9POAL
MAKPHVLVLPLPAQGHVTPLMELSHRLVGHGFEVTFVNTEVHHAMVVGALKPAGGASALAGIHLASVPDGVADGVDRKDICKLVDSYNQHMPGHLEQLIAGMEAAGRPKVKWLVADVSVWWSFDVAKRLGIRVASVWPASVACLAINLQIPKLTEEGLLNNKGTRHSAHGALPPPGRPRLRDHLRQHRSASRSGRQRAAGGGRHVGAGRHPPGVHL